MRQWVVYLILRRKDILQWRVIGLLMGLKIGEQINLIKKKKAICA